MGHFRVQEIERGLPEDIHLLSDFTAHRKLKLYDPQEDRMKPTQP